MYVTMLYIFLTGVVLTLVSKKTQPAVKKKTCDQSLEDQCTQELIILI